MSASKNGKRPTIIGQLPPEKIYPVTEDELIGLEKGEHSANYRQWFFVFLSSSMTVSAAAFFFYLNLPEESIIPIPVIVLLTMLYTAAVVLLVIWQRNKSETKTILQKVRKRIEAAKEEGE